MLTVEEKDYNRIMQQIRRNKEKQLSKLYQDSNVFGISFTEFKKQYKLTRWEKLSNSLSDGELKLDKLSYKLSDGQLRIKKKKAQTF